MYVVTLTVFKAHLKVSGIICGVLVYSLGVFLLGRSQALNKVFKLNEVGKSAQTSQNSIDLPIPYTDSQSGSVIGEVVKLCANTHFGFEISYPNDWFTTYNQEPQQCTFFAPFSFVVPQDPTSFQIPIRAEVINSVDWQETLKFYQNPNDFQNVLSFENLEIEGHEVQKVKATTTQSGSLPTGLLKVSYLFFNAENSVVLTYQQLKPEENTGDFEKTLEEMARSLKFI